MAKVSDKNTKKEILEALAETQVLNEQLAANNEALAGKNEEIESKMETLSETVAKLLEKSEAQKNVPSSESVSTSLKHSHKKGTEIENTRLVWVMNMTHARGEFQKADAYVKFDHFGDMDDIRFEHLKVLKRAYPAYFRSGEIYVVEDDVAEALGLSKVYEEMGLDEELFASLVLKEPNNMINELPKISKELRLSFLCYFIDQASSGNKDCLDMNKWNAIHEYSGIDVASAIESNRVKKERLENL